MKPWSSSPRWHLILGIGAVCFIAHFLLLSQFGLYEDDYLYTLPSFGWGFHDWWAHAWDAIIHPVQARPLNHFVRSTFFALTLHGNTLEGAYLLSWALITTNALLLYRLMAKRLSPAAGAVAALTYLLHPADNARQIIMHQTDIHFGTLLLLCSLNLFQSDRRGLAWFVGAASLINYESFYLPLIVAPFFLLPVPTRDWKKAATHVAVWVAIIAGVAGTRFMLGEDRATAAAESPVAIAAKIGRALFIGPGTSLRLLVQRPLDALLHLSPLLTGVALVIGMISYLLMRERHQWNTEAHPKIPGHPLWIVIGGLLGLMATYLFAFRADSYPPIVAIGRLTALHAPGVLCTAISLSGIFYWINNSKQAVVGYTVRASFAGFFGLMAAFAMEIQMTEYVAHWEKQRNFWHEIFAQAKDATDGTLILVDVEGSESVIPITPGFPRFGTVNYPPQALRYFADLPATWQHPPRVYGLWADTPVELSSDGLRLKTPPYFGPDAQPILHDGNFIFFRVENGRLSRIAVPVDIRGHTLTPKPVTDVSPENELKPSTLYRMLVEPRSGADWFTIRNARNYPN